MTGGGFDEALRGLDRGPEATAEDWGAPAGGAEPAAGHGSVAALRERFGADLLHHAVMAGDEHVVYVRADRVVAVLGWLQSEPTERYDFLADLTAVDYGGGRPLEVVYQLWSIEHKRALRVKATLPLDGLEIDSVCGIWNAANWLEREVFDLFGIHFRGHPDLRRILMPEKYAEGHPLRKDFPLRGRFSRAEQTRRALAMSVEDYYSPEELEIATEAGAQEMAHPPPGTEAGPEVSREVGDAAAEATAHAAHAPSPTHADGWSLGTPGSAAADAPAPPEVTE